jgi:hypothetical protein
MLEIHCSKVWYTFHNRHELVLALISATTKFTAATHHQNKSHQNANDSLVIINQ